MAMKINIIVLLDQNSDKLDLTHRFLDVGKDNDRQRITWWLFGKLGDGTFLPVDGTPPGFDWDAPKPAPGIFSNAEINHGGRSLSIHDTNRLGDPTNNWPYNLRVSYNGKVYEFDLPELGGSETEVDKKDGGRHPVIINK